MVQASGEKARQMFPLDGLNSASDGKSLVWYSVLFSQMLLSRQIFRWYDDGVRSDELRGLILKDFLLGPSLSATLFRLRVWFTRPSSILANVGASDKSNSRSVTEINDWRCIRTYRTALGRGHSKKLTLAIFSFISNQTFAGSEIQFSIWWWIVIIDFFRFFIFLYLTHSQCKLFYINF